MNQCVLYIDDNILEFMLASTMYKNIHFHWLSSCYFAVDAINAHRGFRFVVCDIIGVNIVEYHHLNKIQDVVTKYNGSLILTSSIASEIQFKNVKFMEKDEVFKFVSSVLTNG